jgi:hypothetical protein
LKRLEQEAADVRAHAQKHPNLTLVLGETTDLSQEKQYDASYVFLDSCHTVDMPGQRLTADFNSTQDLAFLAKHLGNVFKCVLLDQSTFHHTQWHVEHLGHFKSLLQPAGIFQFQPYWNTDTSFSAYTFEDYAAFKKSAKQKLLRGLSDTEIKKLAIPEIESTTLRVLPQIITVDAKVKLYQELIPFAMSHEELKLEAFGVSDDEENEALQDKFIAKRAAMRFARKERGIAEESKSYSREDLVDTQKLAHQFTLDALNHQLVVELNQEVYFPYVTAVLEKVFPAVAIVKEPYPQYPDRLATFVKAVK